MEDKAGHEPENSNQKNFYLISCIGKMYAGSVLRPKGAPLYRTFPQKGTGLFLHQNRKYTLGPDMCFFIPPVVKHAL